jgi:hypothetical protein
MPSIARTLALAANDVNMRVRNRVSTRVWSSSATLSQRE